MNGINGNMVRPAHGGYPGNEQIVGKCGRCGGEVVSPIVWHGLTPPTPMCKSCGAHADMTAHLPTLPMK